MPVANAHAIATICEARMLMLKRGVYAQRGIAEYPVAIRFAEEREFHLRGIQARLDAAELGMRRVIGAPHDALCAEHSHEPGVELFRGAALFAGGGAIVDRGFDVQFGVVRERAE